jgi:hypothetical protein
MLTRGLAAVRDQWMGALALFLVIAGGTAYAANTVGSSDIIDDSILSADIKTNNVRADDIQGNSVSSSKLDSGAVQSIDVRDDTLAAIDMAANSVGTSELAAGAVTSSKVVNGTLIGDDIDESTLSGVNADSVKGVDAALIEATVATAAPPITVLSLGGLVLSLSCTDTDLSEPSLTASTAVDNAVIRSRALTDFSTVESINDDDFDATGADAKVLYDTDRGSGLINYHHPAGASVVTVQYMVEGDDAANTCTISGTAFHGTGS